MRKNGRFAFALLMAAAVVLAGCNRGQGNLADGGKKKPVFVYCAEHMTNAFHKVASESLQEAAKAAGADLIIYDAGYDISKQLSQIESGINQKVDAIFVEPVSINGVMPGVEAAEKVGISVISAYAMIGDVTKATSFAGVASEPLGRIQMQRVADDLGGKGNIAVMLGTRGAEAQINRSVGYQNVLKNYPGIQVVFEDAADWNTEKGLKLAENWLQTGIQIDAFVSQDDSMVLGAVKALADKGLTGEIKTYGINAEPDAVKAIKAGILTMTVSQETPTVSQKLIEIAMKLYNGEKVENIYYIDGKVIDSGNVDQYL
jgi:ribose transport system substrate-binding protein/inositol transport system substrate-binding protein